jgi:hypothetical protein
MGGDCTFDGGMCDLAHVVGAVVSMCKGWSMEESDLLRHRRATSVPQVLGC